MTGRHLKWALIASLAVNLGFVGLVAGALLKGPQRGPWPGIALWHYARALPEPYRDDLGRSLREGRGEWVGPREALRGQRKALAAALAADPYDAAAVAALLHREADLTAELSDRGVVLLLAQIERMSPEERRAYAAALTEAGERRRGHRRH
jgi:uncharacterized membrane protein